MSDLIFFAALGALVLTAQHLYALTGWPFPGLVDKT